MDSIGAFAENLINEELGNIREGKTLPPNVPSQGLAPAGIDISDVEVPDSFMQEVLGEQYTPKETPAVEALEPEVEVEEEPLVLTEGSVRELLPLLEEVKTLLKEMSAAMTSSGQIGTNFAGPQKDSKDCSDKKTKKSKKDVLKDSIRNKLKKK